VKFKACTFVADIELLDSHVAKLVFCAAARVKSFVNFSPCKFRRFI
jgi:hypothetical protein